MQVQFNEKTNELTIVLSVNPKSTEPSSTGKTYKLGTDRAKFNCDGREATAAVNVYVPIGGKKGKK